MLEAEERMFHRSRGRNDVLGSVGVGLFPAGPFRGPAFQGHGTPSDWLGERLCQGQPSPFLRSTLHPLALAIIPKKLL